MGEHAKIRNIPDLLSWAAYEDIDECLFKEGSQTILSIVRAFRYESKFESSLSICLDGLSYDDYIVFIKELVKEIELTQKVIDHFDRSDQAERVSHFTAFLLGSLRGMAESLLRLKKWKDAITVLKEALNLKPNDSAIMALLGRAYLEDENLEKSKTISQTDKVIKDRGRAIERESSPTASDISAKVKEESEDEFLNGKLSEAKELKDQEKYSEAIICLKEALIVKPDDENVLLAIGDMCFEFGVFDMALGFFIKLRKVAPENVFVIMRLGETYNKIAQYDKSKEILEKAKELSPNNSNILSKLGCAYLALQQYGEAKEILEKAKELEQNDFSIFNNLGSAYFGLGEFEKAKEMLKIAKELEPTELTNFSKLGYVYLKLEKHEEAKEILEKANELFPDNLGILDGLSYAYLALKQFEKAKEILERTNEIFPDNFKIINNLCWAYLEISQFEKAKKMLEIANILAPAESTILSNLACSYHETGDIYRAQHSIELAHKLDPLNEKILHNRDIILGKRAGELLFLPSDSSGLSVH